MTSPKTSIAMVTMVSQTIANNVYQYESSKNILFFDIESI